jgi:hypothetical protein
LALKWENGMQTKSFFNKTFPLQIAFSDPNTTLFFNPIEFLIVSKCTSCLIMSNYCQNPINQQQQNAAAMLAIGSLI